MASKPNLLYVFADQLRLSSLGYAGYNKAQTPCIDAFSRESLNFTQAVSGHPVCAPYRATLFTGKYTTSTGMVINEIRINPNQYCIGHALSDGGYETAYIGKWHLYANEWGNHEDPRNSFVPPGPDRLGFDDYWAAYGFHHEYYAPTAYYHEDTPEKIYAEAYEPDDMTDLAMRHLKRLRQNPDKPFAMFLSLGTPHDPWVPENVPKADLDATPAKGYSLPPNYLPQDDPHGDAWAHLSEDERKALPEWMRVYDAMVRNLDRNIGRLLTFAKDEGLLEDTIIVFTSDHGECFGAHGRRAKNIFYEEAVRVPFLLRLPGGRRAGDTCDACLNTVDLMPSLLGLLHLPIPKDVQGMDLSPLMRGESGAKEPPFAFLQGTGAVADWEDGHEWRAIRDRQYTYARYRADGSECLFNHHNDPYQMQNLAEDPAYRDIISAYRSVMQAKMDSLHDTFPPSNYYRDHWTRDRKIIQTATERYGG